MKNNMKKWLSAAVLAICSLIMLTSCSHDDDKYEKKVYPVTDDERVSYAEKILGVTIDKEQDWVLTREYSVKITADADLSNIVNVMVLDAHPYVGENFCIASAVQTNGGSATLSFRAPKAADILYAACVNLDGECIARPFTPGVDASVSFHEQLPKVAAAPATTRRSYNVIDMPQSDMFYVKDFYSFRRAVRKALPEGQDNRKLIGDFEYSNTVEVRKNPYSIYDLPLAYIGGNGSYTDNLAYTYYKEGQDIEPNDTFLIKDTYPTGWSDKEYDSSARAYKLEGHRLQHLQDATLVTTFTSTDMVRFHMAQNEKIIVKDTIPLVKVFLFNGYVFVACEEGNNWDYNDRLFMMPQGADRLEKIKAIPVKPDPSKPRVWTYAWEDKDFGDYDMNDCVIQVKENVNDPNKLDITLVALGATHELWLGFDNPNAQSHLDYQHVFENELHQVMGVSQSTMVNTGRAWAKPVTVTLEKPAYFDFQTCSFVLGVKVEPEMQSVYESDYYYIKIATKGQDPHGIVIPEEWRWPTETTCIKDAYPKFVEWSADHTQALDWYKYPVESKVYSTK